MYNILVYFHKKRRKTTFAYTIFSCKYFYVCWRSRVRNCEWYKKLSLSRLLFYYLVALAFPYSIILLYSIKSIFYIYKIVRIYIFCWRYLCQVVSSPLYCFVYKIQGIFMCDCLCKNVGTMYTLYWSKLEGRKLLIHL